MVSSSGESSTSDSPCKVQKISLSSSALSQKSSKRNLRTFALDFVTSSRSPNGLIRPLTKSQPSHLLGGETRRIAQSPSKSPGKLTGFRKRNSPIRKGGGDSERISHSVTSVLAASNSLNGSAADPTDSAAASRLARFKKNKMLAKFAGVLSEHFSAKGSRKDEKAGEITLANGSTKPVNKGLPLGRLTLAQLPLPGNEAFGSLMDHRSIEGNNAETQKYDMSPGKHLMLVDENDFQNGQHLDDPFSDFSSCRQSTEFDSRLKSVQASGTANKHAPITPVSDPFLAERIMDTSANSILKTPPVGCSTPKTRSWSLNTCKSPSKGSQAFFNPTTKVIMISPKGLLTSPQRHRKIAIICGSPTRAGISPGRSQKVNDFGDCTGSPSKVRESCDSTRLSSYPPGLTIRHVPRSMGRLTDVSGAPDLSMPSTMHRKSPPVERKKHPSPSKCQLDLYGKFIDKNLARGIFKDPDELGMDFDSLRGTSSPALAPRDQNRLMKGPVASKIDLRKHYNSQGLYSGLSTNSRSRIPQPVRQLSRSRTETAFARDFLPANHGDLMTGDELQWDSSAYKVGRHHSGRCYHCGSMTEKGM